MAFIQLSGKSRSGALVLALGLCLATSGPITQAQCGGNSPAFPVPEFRGPTRLWPTNGFRPGLPGQQLPANRDSTQYLSTTFPSNASGHELFWALDVVGDKVIVMYNAGIQVWDIAGVKAEDPERLAFKDGILGQWFFHTPPGEADGYLTDVAAIQDPSNSNRILIVVSSLAPIGVTIWRYDRSTGQLTQAYQNTDIEANDVDLINYQGTVYGFFATGPGAYMINVSATNSLATGCMDNACPGGIYMGEVGTAVGSRYVDVIERGGSVYMASTNGGLAVTGPPPEIWELNPSLPTLAARRWVGSIRDTHSPQMFEKGGNYYMAVVEQKRVKIYNVNDCLDSTGCTGLPVALFDHALRNQNWTYHFLTYSVSEGTPFLHYGSEGIFASGPAYERLFDLSNLGITNVLDDITSTGQTYTDACNGLTGIGFWADYQERNDFGLRNHHARKGKFSGKYFYKVNTGTFDVHTRNAIVVVPTVTTNVTSPGPYWFGDPINFLATAQNCSGPEVWTWLSSDTNAIGLGSGDETQTISWNLCPGSSCPQKTVDVWALKAACNGAPNLVFVDQTITISDPRPDISTLNVTPQAQVPNTYPVCTLLNFSADVVGKPTLSYAWTVRDEAEQQIASGASPAFSWNTSGVTIDGPEVFEDGFESGDTSAWDLARPAATAEEIAAGQAILEQVMGAGSANFRVNLVVNNSTNVPDTISRDITLTAIGPMAFTGAAPITVTNLGSGQYRFVANTENATSWRWEFEDPGNGTTTGCQFYTRCKIINFGADDNDVTNSWIQPNQSGTYRARVTADNCLDVPTINAEVSFNVTGIPTGAPPAITTFSIVPNANCSLSLNVMECRRNQAIGFTATHSGTATHYDFDWEGDGTFEESVTAGAAVTHTWATTGVRAPKVRARNGGGTPSAAAGLPWIFEIVN
jgi:hypothetical protein